ncbi:helix-turn-helix transcriptional regulator [Streptomyces xinghaiensis]|uniref:XRE family transcriptional regulator n=2 Tax=Streptomyces TaxID=1883 RepID=A0A3M8ESA5_9ACTN|nr:MULTISPECIES: helix-turn-helix transcriptional regulator [Streptomyces]KNE81018.1 hypothetical protein ADZ36_18735 [Streptomyces fradiae]OFA49705.1 hypothetical protein BEN35_16780 [Streptomyces fradiae]PQM19851.1 XRE family transcriptional regulator [Streptomyces xinghaiensis]RKM90867.1 XRE family transcriptional regulator [Streptomyces xinghaiensis]RNC68817.1 XRE family transcriptional regulator [Streptomyces xinghaiensis]
MDEIAPPPGADPRASTLAFFGAELRLRRMAAGMKQTELARALHCAPSLICKIESAARAPQEDFAERCDEVLGTDGLFVRLWPVIVRNAYRPWFRPFVELEQQATSIRAFETQLVPGLLQTRDYARAVLAGRRPDELRLEKALMARMHRQRLLEREEPPRFWAVLEESAIRRKVGGPAVMRAQLARLLDVMERPRIVLQVLPSDVAVHPALGGAFWHLTFEQGPEVVYLEGFYEGQLRAEPEVVEAAGQAYDLLRAQALPPDASADLIAAVMEELTPWTTQQN